MSVFRKRFEHQLYQPRPWIPSKPATGVLVTSTNTIIIGFVQMVDVRGIVARALSIVGWAPGGSGATGQQPGITDIEGKS